MPRSGSAHWHGPVEPGTGRRCIAPGALGKIPLTGPSVRVVCSVLACFFLPFFCADEYTKVRLRIGVLYHPLWVEVQIAPTVVTPIFSRQGSPVFP